MIRNIFLLLMLQVLSILATAQVRGSFKLQCKFASPASGYIYLTYDNSNKGGMRDSSMIKEGKAEFKGTVSGPTFARMVYNQKEKELFIEPAIMVFTVDKNDFSKGTIMGSKSQKEFDVLKGSIQKIQDRWKIVMDTMMAINKRSNAEFQEKKTWVLFPYFREIEEANLDFFNKYPTSYAAAYNLQFVARDLSTDSVKLFYNRFSTQLKQSMYGKTILNEIEKRKLGAVGTMAADFSKPDIDGNKISLADFKGKVVLLDFWASWCVPCRKGNPHLIELYTTYKERGMEIIGIAADDRTPDAWRKAVKDDKLPWLQVLQGTSPDENISTKYNVVYLPARILIDKDGKVIGRYNEDEDELTKILASIFK